MSGTGVQSSTIAFADVGKVAHDVAVRDSGVGPALRECHDSRGNLGSARPYRSSQVSSEKSPDHHSAEEYRLEAMTCSGSGFVVIDGWSGVMDLSSELKLLDWGFI